MAKNTQRRDPWSRQTGESAEAFRAFQRYLFLDPDIRSIRQAAGDWYAQEAVRRKSGESKATGSLETTIDLWERWSSRNRWVERVRAYEDDLFQKELDREERNRRKIVLMRSRCEVRHQEKLERLADQQYDKCEAALKLPNTDIEQTKYGPNGEIVSEQRIKGVRLGEIAKFSAEYRQTVATAVLGPVRVTRSERIVHGEDGAHAGDGAGGGPLHLELDEWPDEGGSGPTA